MQGDKRRRAGGVDRETRPVKVEDVRNAVGDDRKRISGGEIRVRQRRIVQGDGGVVERRSTDVDPCPASRQLRWGEARILASLEDELEQQALLRIDLLGLARRNPEGGRIKTPDVVENARRPRVAASGLLRSRVPEAL